MPPPAASDTPAPLTALLPAETSTPKETQALGAALAGALSPGAVLALYGDLGAGKTQLVKGLCAALGVPSEEVRSPTFTLLHEYAGRTPGGRALPLYHVDAYRIEQPGELFELGYEEYFYGNGVCLVEWPSRIEALLPEGVLRLRLTHQGGNRRRIELIS